MILTVKLFIALSFYYVGTEDLVIYNKTVNANYARIKSLNTPYSNVDSATLSDMSPAWIVDVCWFPVDRSYVVCHHFSCIARLGLNMALLTSLKISE